MASSVGAIDRALVLGGGGMLGQALSGELVARGTACEAPTRGQLDLVDTAAVEAAIERLRPSVVFNCAAYTDVDACETNEEYALEVNGRAVGRLAELAQQRSTPLVHVSSDYVFDGSENHPYREDAPTGPRSAYGRSKLLGEQLALASSSALVVRASWLFGPGARNFVATMLHLARSGQPLRVVDDQVGLPTYTIFLARALVDLAGLVRSGAVPLPTAVHYGNGPAVSWFGFTRGILEVWKLESPLIPVTTEEFLRPAQRPAYSVLDTSRTEHRLGRTIEGWRVGLEDYRRREERQE